MRDWKETAERTKELWRAVYKFGQKSRLKQLAKEWGIRDSLNAQFIKRIGEMHSANSSLEEIYEVWLKLGEEMANQLFNPFLGLNGLCLYMPINC